jgi:hypothetical protein
VAAPDEAGLAGNPVHSCSPSEHDEDEGPNFVVSPNVDIDEIKLAPEDVTFDAEADVRRRADDVLAAVESGAMPPGGGVTDDDLAGAATLIGICRTCVLH